ncbi:glycoside hydrolase family 88 protein [Parapedobacter sp. 10938]|uniref:glycoside hydrolase family 88 protein n=1 Tax=Parapedobacter flavus TaxID=3110225 RepID=UPI002DB722F4|nr:glycoside hydrolase family 88 protein [Parapedobacter sp. 10938]MEC3880783.1 glycoside hydrolase family 88 protein [Parapedobacter sp. 10938]
MLKLNLLGIAVLCFMASSFVGCTAQKGETPQGAVIDSGFARAEIQLANMLDTIAKYRTDSKFLPKSVGKNGKNTLSGIYDWTSGFFPGTLWYAYEYSQDQKWKTEAEKWTAYLEPVKDFHGHHDVGFMINSSYGNGYRLTGNATYKDIIVQAARSLSKRYNEKVGAILSWDVDKGWQSERGWEYPVIIDNMINLELLFKAAELSGDSSFYNIAVSHADRTLENHFRPDYSSFHVVDYDPETGEVRHRHTAQGYAHESAWARGQAWAVYGYALCYDATGDERYLAQAQHIADYILNHPNLPDDLIPFWDFNDPKIPNTYRDASAGAIIASALLSLSEMATPEKAARYKTAAIKMLQALSSADYLAQPGTNNGFILKHSVGSIPHDNEIDVPLAYADYYYLEALLKYRATLNGGRIE